MVLIWDYDINELKKTESGRRLILERMINYGPDGEKIKLSEVKKYWNELNIRKSSRQLFELLIGKENLPTLRLKKPFRREKRFKKIWPLIYSS